MTLRIISRWFCLISALQLSCDNEPEKAPARLEFYAFGHDRDKPAYWATVESTPIDGYPTMDELLDGEVSGADVYGLGMIETYDRIYPAYWKNGEIVELPVGGTYGSATSLVIDGSDVYAVGYTWTEGDDGKNRTVPRYWKNGQAVELPGTTNGFSRAIGIAISGSDVHVIGWEDVRFKGVDSTYAIYWKNGQRTRVTPISHHTVMLDIALKGTDVLIAGIKVDESRIGKAILWTNGVPESLTSDVMADVATHIMVVGDDVYIGGAINNKVAYWKNGEMTTLETGALFSSSISDMIWQNDKLIISGWNYGIAGAYEGSFVWSEGKLLEPFTGDDGTIYVTGISPRP